MRLQRVGRAHEPAFRLVLTDSTNATRSGKFKEILGSYDPRKEADALSADRIKYWLANGAQPTDSVHNLLVKHKIIDAKKIHVSTKSSPVPPPAETPAEESATETQAEAPVETPTESPAETPSEEPAPAEAAPEPAPQDTAEGATIEKAE